MKRYTRLEKFIFEWKMYEEEMFLYAMNGNTKSRSIFS